MDNLGEMDTFLETYNLPKLSQEVSENMCRQITTNKIEALIKTFLANKRPGPDGFTGEFYPTFKELTYSSQTIPKNSRGRKTSKLFI